MCGKYYCTESPAHSPAILTVSFRNWLGRYSNAFPRLTRLSWVVRFWGQTMKAQLILMRIFLHVYFMLLIHQTILCSHETHIYTIQAHRLLFYTSKASVILFSLIWTFSPSLFMGGTVVYHFCSHTSFLIGSFRWFLGSLCTCQLSYVVLWISITTQAPAMPYCSAYNIGLKYINSLLFLSQHLLKFHEGLVTVVPKKY